METTTPATDTPATGKAALALMLEGFLEMVEADKIQSLVIGYVGVDGGAAIQSTPMSPVMLNHVSKLLERRVNRQYDQALARANAPRAPSGGVPEVPRQDPTKLPRNVRRQVEKAQRKMHQKNRDKLAVASEPVIRMPKAAK